MASVAKRTWKTNGVEKNGWVVRYRDPSGKHRSKAFERKKEADTFRAKVHTELDAGNHIAVPDGLKVNAICDAFLAHAETRVANKALGNGSYLQFLRAIDNYVRPHLGHRRLIDLTALDIEEWISSLRRTKRARTKRGLAPATIVSLFALMKRIEDFAFRRRWTNKRVVAEARKDVGPIRVDPIRTFSVDELRQLLRAVDMPVRGRTPRDRELIQCFVYLAAFCGLRLGEIAGLKLENVDFAAGVVRVRNSLSQFDGLKGPKTKAGIRDVPMPPGVRAALEAFAQVHWRPNPDGLLFTTGAGALTHRDKWNVTWKAMLRLAGLDGGGSLHFHALRHFAASVMIEHRIPLPDVAKLLGHNTFDMTLQVYAHPTQDVSRHLGVLASIEGVVTASPMLQAPMQAVAA